MKIIGRARARRVSERVTKQRATRETLGTSQEDRCPSSGTHLNMQNTTRHEKRKEEINGGKKMLSKKELFNARSASEKLEAGLEIPVVNVGTYPDKDKDGNDVVVSVLVSEDGTVYAGISATVAESIPMLDELLEEAKASGETCVIVEVMEKKSNNGRNFMQLKAL